MLGSLPGISTGGGGLDMGGGGPSTATSTTTNNSGFTGGAVNMGSNNGIPSWVFFAGAVGIGAFIFMRKKRAKK